MHNIIVIIIMEVSRTCARTFYCDDAGLDLNGIISPSYVNITDLLELMPTLADANIDIFIQI